MSGRTDEPRLVLEEEAIGCPCCRELGELDDDGTPVAERERRLLDAEDWGGLIALRERQLARHPGEPHCILRLAEVHAAAGDYETSLAVAGDGYREHPDDLWLEDAVLEALLALGRSEHDFPWFGETPPVLRLDDRLMERVRELVAVNQRELEEPSDPYLIYHQLQDEAFLAFRPQELIEAVRADPAFVVDGPEDEPWTTWILAASAGTASGASAAQTPGDQVRSPAVELRARCHQ